jgi:hypothetical protein
MWEIEGLIEYAIQLVDKTNRTNEEKVQLIGNLYAIQNEYDCKFTNFRVMPILLKTGYTKTIDYTEHPDYEGNEAWFKKLLKKEDIEFINRDIKKRWSLKNDVAAYFEKESGKIYIDFGSPLRKHEPALELMDILDLSLLLIREAHILQDKGNVYDWTTYLIKFGSMTWADSGLSAEELINRYFKEIKTIWHSYDFSDYKPMNDDFTLFAPGSGKSDGFNEYILNDGVAGEIVRYFFDVKA